MVNVLPLSSARIVPASNFPKCAFVTGATGFVGANLARALLEGGSRVRAIVRRGSDRTSLDGLDVEICEGDLLDLGTLASALSGCDACFHAAALITGEPEELRRTNVDGTRSVLTAALRAGCSAIVHTSTMGTLWRKDGGPATESDRLLAPGASAYVRSKFEAEELARELARGGAPIVIVHPSAPVGPWDRVPTVSGKRIAEVLAGKLPRWIAGAINHVPVRDVAQGMLLAASRGKPGESYLLAHRHGNLMREEFVKLVSDAAGIPPAGIGRARRWLSWLRPRSPSRGAPSAGPLTLACDPAWTIEQLGLPQTPLQAAFREAVEWFRRPARHNS